MIESCTRRRMVFLIGALLICSCLILFLEEYMEESVSELANHIKNREPLHGAPGSSGTVQPSQPTIAATDNHKEEGDAPRCPDINEKPHLTKDCQRCSAFELSALQSEHCTETGYFSEWTCPTGNITKLRPCLTKGMRRSSKFYLFTISSIASMCVFGAFVKWRKDLISQRILF